MVSCSSDSLTLGQEVGGRSVEDQDRTRHLRDSLTTGSHSGGGVFWGLSGTSLKKSRGPLGPTILGRFSSAPWATGGSRAKGSPVTQMLRKQSPCPSCQVNHGDMESWEGARQGLNIIQKGEVRLPKTGCKDLGKESPDMATGSCPSAKAGVRKEAS